MWRVNPSVASKASLALEATASVRCMFIRLATATALAATVVAVPSAHAQEPNGNATARKPVPTLAMCAGAFISGRGDAGNAVNITIGRRPAIVVADCPEGSDDDPRLPSGDTFISNIDWQSWNRQRAVGSGTLNIPMTVCTVPDSVPADTRKTMCETGGEVTNTIENQTYDVTFTLTKPRWYTYGKGKNKKRVRTFTQVNATFPNGGPNGEGSQTYNPPRRYS